MKYTTFIPAVFLAMAACADAPEVPLPNDMVKDAPAAIRIAKATCAFGSLESDERSKKSAWKAKLHNRIWEVWLEGSECGHERDAQVSAADGKASECKECVTWADYPGPIPR